MTDAAEYDPNPRTYFGATVRTKGGMVDAEEVRFGVKDCVQSRVGLAKLKGRRGWIPVTDALFSGLVHEDAPFPGYEFVEVLRLRRAR